MGCNQNVYHDSYALVGTWYGDKYVHKSESECLTRKVATIQTPKLELVVHLREEDHFPIFLTLTVGSSQKSRKLSIFTLRKFPSGMIDRKTFLIR